MSALPSHFSLYKRGEVYHITWLVHGRRRWKSTGAVTKPEALEALSKFQALLEVTPKPVLVREFVQDFLAYARTVYAPKTLEIYERVLPRFAKITGSALVSEVTAEHFDRYKALRLQAVRVKKNKEVLPTRPASVNVELRAIRAAFGAARRWKLLEHNPFDGVTLAGVPEQSPAFLSVEDFDKLLALIREGWLREVVLFAVLTGMRRGEILNLRWSDVDMERRLVSIETGPTFKTKQGRRRTVPLNDTAIHVLRARQGKSPSELVFTLNDRQIFDDWASHLFKRYVVKAKLPATVRFHSLRHSFASWLVQKGATLYEVQHLLGHSSSAVTEVYAHLRPEHLREAAEKIIVKLN